MAAKVPLDRIEARLKTVINNLGDLVEGGDPARPDPYVSDALAFATQAKVCVGKQIQTQVERGGTAPKKAGG